MSNTSDPPSSIPRFAVILPAAGAGRRFGGDKLARTLAGRSVLEHSVRAFIHRADVVAVIVARSQQAPLPVSPELLAHPKLRRCEGGASRAHSVRRGLEAVAALPSPPMFVAVHDAARPAVSRELIDHVFAAAVEHGAAVPGVAVTDTIKRVIDGEVAETLPRAQLVAVQTPQAMRRDWLIDAFDKYPLPLEEITDDVQLLELAGYPVRVVEGQSTNVKLTTPEDVERIEAIS